MSLFEAFILALIQGLTEFLPVSSSGHLVLGSKIFGWPDQGLAFDVAVHLGSLVAVMVYFRHDVKALLLSFFAQLFRREQSPAAKLAWWVLIATIPVGLCGLLFNDFIEAHFRSVVVVAMIMIGFAPFLLLADLSGSRRRDEFDLKLKDVLIIGFAQAIALIPGISRSGATMLAGLGLGLSRKASARFSFLLSIPVIILAAGYKSVELIESQLPVDWQALMLGFIVSSLSAYACIHAFLQFLDRIGFWPFALYLLAFGVSLLVTFY